MINSDKIDFKALFHKSNNDSLQLKEGNRTSHFNPNVKHAKSSSTAFRTFSKPMMAKRTMTTVPSKLNRKKLFRISTGLNHVIKQDNSLIKDTLRVPKASPSHYIRSKNRLKKSGSRYTISK